MEASAMWRKREFWNSLVIKLLSIIMLILLPLIVIHIVNNYYSVEVIRNQVVQSNKNMLNLHMNQIDYSLQGVGNYVYQLSESDDLIYYQSNINVDYNEYLKAKIRLYNKMSSQSHFYTTIDSIFIYSTSYEDMIYTHFGSDIMERELITNEVQKKIENEPEELSDNHWSIWKGKDQYYLFYIVKKEDVYMGAWVIMEQLVTIFKFIDFDDTGRALITTADYTTITETEFVNKESINLNLNGDSHENSYTTSGEKERYIVINETSFVANFNIFALIPESAILQNIPILQRVSWVISIDRKSVV